MATPVIIKKYANRRLYNTQSSVYVTFDDLAAMVKREEDFIVVDAKSGEDLTRGILTQIIFELESNNEQTLLPASFLRQLIRFYGDSLQTVIPGFLDLSMQSFVKDQEYWRRQLPKAFGLPFEAYEQQIKQNMNLFEQAFGMFALSPKMAEQPPHAESNQKEIEALQAELDQVKRQLDKLMKTQT